MLSHLTASSTLIDTCCIFFMGVQVRLTD
jgi:hypothetical protein